MRALVLAVAAIMALSATARAACDLGGVPMLRAELLFGRTAAPAADWADFLAHSVTPRFPDGLTVLDGQGQWLNPKTGAISREASSVLEILVPMSADLKARLNAVRDDYRSRFHQQSVGLVTSMVCADF